MSTQLGWTKDGEDWAAKGTGNQWRPWYRLEWWEGQQIWDITGTDNPEVRGIPIHSACALKRGDKSGALNYAKSWCQHRSDTAPLTTRKEDT